MSSTPRRRAEVDSSALPPEPEGVRPPEREALPPPGSVPRQRAVAGPRRRRATLASLAAELKVSRTTVSNAYNRPDQLSAHLRERVLATAERLGYPGPDPVARSLRTRR